MQILRDSIIEIPVERILEPKFFLRAEISRAGLLALTESIRSKGLLQPVIVRPLSNGSYELVAGLRRFKACRMMNRSTIACHIVDVTDKEAMEIAIIENVHHETINPIDEAVAYKRYCDEYGFGSLTDLASKINKSQEYISLRLALLKLPKEVLDAIISRQISPSTAQELLPLNPNQQRRLVALIIRNSMSKRLVRKAVKLMRDEDEERGSDTLDDRLALLKTTSLLKIALIKLDRIIRSVPRDSPMRKTLMDCRSNISTQIESLSKVR